jgi:hypothetical protein
VGGGRGLSAFDDGCSTRASRQGGGSLAAQQPNANQCKLNPGQGGGGRSLKQSVKLVSDLPSQTVNFGGSRGWEFVYVVLTATPALPSSVTSNQIRLSILRPFTRTSQTLPTATAPIPKFTEPMISSGRDRVTFTVCLNGAGLPAGSFTGTHCRQVVTNAERDLECTLTRTLLTTSG